MAKINEKLLQRVLKGKEPIEVNMYLIKKVLGFHDMRDFTSELYHWGYQTGFTYRDSLTESWQRHLIFKVLFRRLTHKNMDLYQKKWVGGFVIGSIFGAIAGALIAYHVWVLPLLEVINK